MSFKLKYYRRKEPGLGSCLTVKFVLMDSLLFVHHSFIETLYFVVYFEHKQVCSLKVAYTDRLLDLVLYYFWLG